MTASHRIDELLFDLAFESPTMALARTEELRSLVVDKLLPLMEAVFDQFGDDDTVWQIDKLVVDVGNVTEAQLPTALAAGLRTALEEALHGADGSMTIDAPARGISRRGGDHAVLLTFLANGTMSWQVDAAATASYEALLSRILEQNSKDFLQALAAAPHRTVMLARLARQFSPAQLQALLRKMNDGHADAALSLLAQLQELLQDAALARTTCSGALYAGWEEVLSCFLDGKHGGWQSLPQALTGRALHWLAQQQHQDIAATAAQLLQERAIHRPGASTAGDIFYAVSRLAATETMTSLPSAKTAAPALDLETAGQGASMPMASENKATADDLPQEWQELAQRRNDGALLQRLVQRLVQQPAPATMQTILHYFNPHHAKAMHAQLDALQRMLERLSVSSSTLQVALAAAWEYVLGVSIAQPSQLPATLPMLVRTIAVLASAPLASTAVVETTTAAASAAVQHRTQVLAQLREAGVALGDPAGLATALMVMQTMQTMEGMEGQQTASLSVAPMPPVVEDTAPQVESHTPGIWQEPASAVVPIRNRITSALMGGKAGDIYDDWRTFQNSQPDLLRSAILHYGGYAEIREKIASTFPLSLLRDMQLLLAPAAAALTELLWDDERLRTRLGAHGATQWSRWQRNWWRGAIAHLLQAARLQEAPASAASASFDTAAYVAAALKSTGADDADEELIAYVMALAQKTQEKNENDKKQPPEPLPTLSLSALFDAIRDGAQPLQSPALNMEQLEKWVREAVREPSFYQAIADHAELAQDRRAYYVQVLEALAQNRIVDLEAFAAAEEAVLDMATQEPASIGISPVLSSTAPLIRVDSTNAQTTPSWASSTIPVDVRDKAYLVSRLAKALMKGDSALLYDDWDILLHKHAPLLLEALRHYGIGDDILERIVSSFPESMLYDMAVLLAPTAIPLWRQLRDQLAWTALPLDNITSLAQEEELSLPTPQVLVVWKRQLWKAALRRLLLDVQYGNGNVDTDDSASHERAPEADIGVIRALLSSLTDDVELTRTPWQRRILKHWTDLSVQQYIARQDHIQNNAPDREQESPAVLAEIFGNENKAEAEGTDGIKVILEQILEHRQRFSATEALPQALRADLRQRFAHLKNNPGAIGESWTAADMEIVVEACVLAHAADDASSASSPQRETFLQAIKMQAPSTPVPDRARYFRTVLQALLQEQMLDLEEIAEASRSAQANLVQDKRIDPAAQEEPVHATDRPVLDHQAFIDFLLAADFRAGAALPAGLPAWLQQAVDTAAPEVAPMLAQLSRHPEAMARLLEIVPASSWRKLAALSPYAPQQVQRMQRYACDVADMFAEQNQQLSTTTLARLEWRFLLPYLHAPERIFEPARFTSELVGFLSRESGLPAPAGLAARLRSQMGISVASPRTDPATSARTLAHADTDGKAKDQANINSKDKDIANSRIAQTNGDDETASQSSADIHLVNAGMVLIWPFLSRAWEVLELTREGKFINDDAAQRAAWLLQFAVDEQTAVPEYQLPLNKLLCGIALQAPIVPEIEIMEQERELVEQMLTVVISHWTALGQTSIQGLRETFLQREGYLSRKEDAWRLRVPKRTFDMLLDKLPWSISTIRLPWMKSILWVEWT